MHSYLEAMDLGALDYLETARNHGTWCGVVDTQMRGWGSLIWVGSLMPYLASCIRGRCGKSPCERRGCLANAWRSTLNCPPCWLVRYEDMNCYYEAMQAECAELSDKASPPREIRDARMMHLHPKAARHSETRPVNGGGFWRDEHEGVSGEGGCYVPRC